MIILNTVKGSGVKYFEDAKENSHSMPINEEIRVKSIAELDGE